MNRALISFSSAMLILGGNVAASAANLFLDLDPTTLGVARGAVQTALENRARGEAEFWSVPGVAEGTVMPLRTWRSSSGHWCREFHEWLQIADGRAQTSIAVRCRTPDGHWRQTRG